ncbi:MAG: TIM barrel protein [Caldilineaceae bacterium]|nr:TIM barrel protein [Caldilineaceae bacterium]
METSICSYSFHRSFADGAMDIFDYIQWCHETGFTQLDPWMKHLEPGLTDPVFVDRVLAAGEKVGMPFGCIAVDGAHIYEEDEVKRANNRRMAYRWIDIADRLGAAQVRIDAGGPEEMTDAIFAVIVEGYKDVIGYAAKRDIEVIVENHWGPTKHPENVVRLLENIDGLGLLFDTNNWAEGKQEEGWERCAKYARLTHVKTFSFDEAGNDPSVDLSKAMRLLQEAGYNGVWGVESCPLDGDEKSAGAKTLALIKREVKG